MPRWPGRCSLPKARRGSGRPRRVAPIRVGVGENLFTQSDKAWAELQPLVAPAFRKKALDARLAEIDALIDDEVAAIPLDTTIDLELAMGRIALSLAAWVLLGEQLDRRRAEEIAHHQREVVRWVGVQLGKLTGFIPVAPGARGREMKRHRAVLNAYADEVIARAKRHRRGRTTTCSARCCGHDRRATRSRPSGCEATCSVSSSPATRPPRAALSWALVHGARTPAGVGQRPRRARSSHGAVPHRVVAPDSRSVGHPANTDQGRASR